MYKKLFFASIGLWILALGTFGFFFITGATTKSTDNRKAIHLVPAEKDVVLREMRQVLTALNGTLKALGNDNFKEASIASGKAGKGMAVDVNPVIMAKLPLEFKQLGMSMHGDFDVLSADLAKGLDQRKAIQRLGEISNKCIACHATYRLSTEN